MSPARAAAGTGPEAPPERQSVSYGRPKPLRALDVEALRLPDGRALRLYRRPGSRPTQDPARLGARSADAGPADAARAGRCEPGARPAARREPGARPAATAATATELRRDPLRGEWVAYAAGRQDRTHLPARATCPFCPGAAGAPATEIPHADFEVAVLDNRFPSLHPPQGSCEVVVYGPEHDGSFGTLPATRAKAILRVWRDRYRELSARPEVQYVLCFENRGEEVGVTIQHPHGQVYAFGFLPPVPTAERAADGRAGGCAVCAALAAELSDGRRVVHRSATAVAYVPRAARWPFEVHVTVCAHRASLTELEEDELDGVADALQRVLRGYDQLAGGELPYVLAVHQAPTDGGTDGHVHAEITTPYRGPGRLKHLAGVEQAAGTYLVDALPERTAPQLAEAMRRGD